MMLWSVLWTGQSRPKGQWSLGKRGVPSTLMSAYPKTGEKTSRNWKQGVNFL